MAIFSSVLVRCAWQLQLDKPLLLPLPHSPAPPCPSSAAGAVYIYATDQTSNAWRDGKPNCWLNSAIRGSRTNAGRVLGRIRPNQPPGPPPPPPPAPAPSPSAPPLTRDSLSITIKSLNVTWRPGDAPIGNLKGTISSWNEVLPSNIAAEGSPGLQDGLLSTQGWSIVDDTASQRFGEVGSGRGRPATSPPPPLWMGKAPWIGSKLAAPPVADWYFFGCGNRFRACLSDLSSISGAIAMPPRAAFGVWWSHEQAYSQLGIQQEVLAGYANYSLPLNVLQMDYQWSVLSYSTISPAFRSTRREDLMVLPRPL